jgi:tRNA (guanine37-N1)-methyltransferase
MLKIAQEKAAVDIGFVNPRDFTTDKHRTTDSPPYGGGPGMVMQAGPIFEAVESVREPASYVVLMSPQGRRFEQAIARDLSVKTHLVMVCGHYEGVDERIRTGLVDDEISIGDYVLTNGALAAGVVVDAVVRLLPGVLGASDATEEESFTNGLLEYPQYTRPATYRDMEVPEVLRSGNHGAIKKWRIDQARRRSALRRPDLLQEDSGSAH